MGHWRILSRGGCRATKISRFPLPMVSRAEDSDGGSRGAALSNGSRGTLISLFLGCDCTCGLRYDPEFPALVFSDPVFQPSQWLFNSFLRNSFFLNRSELVSVACSWKPWFCPATTGFSQSFADAPFFFFLPCLHSSSLCPPGNSTSNPEKEKWACRESDHSWEVSQENSEELEY